MVHMMRLRINYFAEGVIRHLKFDLLEEKTARIKVKPNPSALSFQKKKKPLSLLEACYEDYLTSGKKKKKGRESQVYLSD